MEDEESMRKKQLEQMTFRDKMFDIIIPCGSRRRTLFNICHQVLTHPKQIIHYLHPYKIKRVFYYLFHDGLRGVNKVLEDRMLMGSDLKLSLTIRKRIQSDCINSYPSIIFPHTERPQVSIIIPVHNQFEYTYACLRSIFEHTEGVAYEIIIADDCSLDLTRNITEIVKGIQVVKTKRQSYFLRNCNHAAGYAKGEYLLFLNNDTQVQKNWLPPLVALLERDGKIGMTGSCLVYPDGKLQEAGGILWDDGSAWNYGNGHNPALPEYRYVKEVDYISGAAIMIRKSLWDDVGGFDERFMPAYCEDSDLAFTVRQKGYKVVYQPSSIVVHFEGISNGTRLDTGIKAYQVENQQKFFEKWKEVLKSNHLPNGQTPFVARDRGQLRKRILIIDHRVPMYDRDAGARTVIMYTKLFLELGMHVTFLPNDFFPFQPYTSELEQMGVEVLYGNYFVEHCKDWLIDNSKYFDYIYTNRPQVSMEYIDLLKKYTKAKIIYYGHDLHYLREQRQYELEHNEELLKSSNRWKKIEFELIRKSDVIYAVGEYEATVIKKEFPEKTIRSVPAYIYDEIPEERVPILQGRKNLLFVGGFGHPPNIDAVLWFGKHIFPEILKVYTDIIWYIVGAKATDEIKKMENGHIKLLGYVSDEELRNLYRTCRLVVIPLRYGAGVKGKVVECMYYQAPFITTPIGAEGLGITGDEFAIVDADSMMAGAIVDLYGNDEKLMEIMQACRPYINSHFTRKQALEAVLSDIQVGSIVPSRWRDG